MAKVTLATVKSFITKNRTDLHVLQHSSFDGMTDCVQSSKQTAFLPAVESDNPHANNMAIRGVWFVFGSRDYFSHFENGSYIGYEVSNSCGSFTVAIQKQALAA